MKNHFQMLGYAVAVAGVCLAASRLSPGFLADSASVVTPVSVGALGVSLALSAVWGGQRPTQAVANGRRR